jgi:large subunit ribosomal protein L28
MSRICVICGKIPISGNRYAYRGALKKKGGTGRKTTRVTKRRFLPNLQKIKINLNGRIKRMYVCTRCIKEGRIQKPPL